MVNTVVFLFVCVGINVVMHVHILELKFCSYIFHSTTLVLYQCTVFLPSIGLLCIYLLVLLSGVGRAPFPHILPQNHRLVPGVCFRVSIHKVTGVLLRHHVILFLFVGFHTNPNSYLFKDVPIVHFPLRLNLSKIYCGIMDIYIMIYSALSTWLFR